MRVKLRCVVAPSMPQVKTKSGVRIRPAVPADLDALHDLEKAIKDGAIVLALVSSYRLDRKKAPHRVRILLAYANEASNTSIARPNHCAVYA